MEVNGRPWFRLLAGAAADPDALALVRERLTGSPIPSGVSRDWFVRRADLAFLVAEFPTVEGAEEEVSALASYMARLLDEAGLQDVRLTERMGVRP